MIDVNERAIPAVYRLSVISLEGGRRIMRSIFGNSVFPNVLDCGIGRIVSEAVSASDLASKVQASLGTMCAADTLRGLEVINTCQASRPEDRKYSILFSQEFPGAGSNVIEVQKPCPGL